MCGQKQNMKPIRIVVRVWPMSKIDFHSVQVIDMWNGVRRATRTGVIIRLGNIGMIFPNHTATNTSLLDLENAMLFELNS